MRAGNLLAIWVLLLMPACAPRFIRLDKPALIEQNLEQIAEYNKRILQLKASLDIKGTGIFGSFVHEQADILVKQPHFLFWALRSFFGPPAMVVASNGQYLTIYDFLNDGHAHFQKMALTTNSAFDMFDFTFHPRFLMDLLLARIPLEGATDLELFLRQGELSLGANLPNGWRLESSFDAEKKQVLFIKLTHTQMRISYQSQYQKYQNVDGISFPMGHVLIAKNKAKSLKFAIHFSKVELNGAPVDDHRFYLQEP